MSTFNLLFLMSRGKSKTILLISLKNVYPCLTWLTKKILKSKVEIYIPGGYEISILLSAWTVRAWTCVALCSSGRAAAMVQHWAIGRPQQVPNISVTSWHMGQQLEVERLSLLWGGNQPMIHLSLMAHYD